MESLKIVIVGHVDHGKSTVIGRLLADTNSLPEGKLEQVKSFCEQNSRPFEYAFLLDALKDEQSQGITIDSARCFFKSKKREYIIIDAPGHIEFLKNMISGAARAEAALLVIDANEGIQENSKRHGYMLSMLGIKQVTVLVNKMDLVDYDEHVFNDIKRDYTEFLNKINIDPLDFIPVSAFNGENIVKKSKNMKWFNGDNVLESLDKFKKEEQLIDKPFRMYVQDVYKFTTEGDSRRIISGRIDSGSIKVGDKVIFFPSNKKSRIRSIECFNKDKVNSIDAGYSIGFTLEEQVYIKRGELMCKEGEKFSNVSSVINTNIFWMGKKNMDIDKWYKLKIGSSEVQVKINKILSIMDASDLSLTNRNYISRHEVANCVLVCKNPISFDLFKDLPFTGRFVIVDDYEIAGGGIIEGCEYRDDSEFVYPKNVFKKEDKPLILACGLSGSGKTYNSSLLSKELNDYVVVGPGIIRKELGIKSWSRKDTPLAISKVIEKIEQLHKIGVGAIVDANMRSSDIRQFYYDLGKYLNIEVVTIEFYCDEKECKRRMMERAYLKIENPNDAKFYDQQSLIWQSPVLDIDKTLENDHVSFLRYDTLNEKLKIVKVTEKSKPFVEDLISKVKYSL